MFIGREEELELLCEQARLKKASFVAIKGRRRIGKSRLIEEFAKKFPKVCFITGLPPTEKVSAQDQKNEFARQLANNGVPVFPSQDWGELFRYLHESSKSGKVMISLDEISWMGSKDPTFLPKLKVAWDLYFSKNPNLFLVICSSISSWIEKNILNSTGFFGRIDLTIDLKELSLKECCQFWGKKKHRLSAVEILKVLAVTGGVPKYLEMIHPNVSAEDNIKRLCFSYNGGLIKEYDRIFHDLFSSRSQTYRKIIQELVCTPGKLRDEIAKNTNIAGRPLTEYLDDLVAAGFCSRDFTWSIKTGALSRQRRYRLQDNYLRFYLKYVEPNLAKIQQKRPTSIHLHNLPQWQSIMGYQFENLVLHNFDLIQPKLRLMPEDILCEGPYFQTKTKRRRGCQIDYLIQTRSNTLYICEIKFSTKTLGLEVIDAVKEKINRLESPKHVSKRAVLIHVGPISKEVENSELFDAIVDFTEFLDDYSGSNVQPSSMSSSM